MLWEYVHVYVRLFVPYLVYSLTCSTDELAKLQLPTAYPSKIPPTNGYTRLTFTVFMLFLAFSSPSPIDLRVSSSILDCSVLFLAAPAPLSSALKLTRCAHTADGRMPLPRPSEPLLLKHEWRITRGMGGISLLPRFRLASWWRWQQDSTIAFEGGIRFTRGDDEVKLVAG